MILDPCKPCLVAVFATRREASRAELSGQSALRGTADFRWFRCVSLSETGYKGVLKDFWGVGFLYSGAGYPILSIWSGVKAPCLNVFVDVIADLANYFERPTLRELARRLLSLPTSEHSGPLDSG